jgi:hypothetical protein
MAKTVGVRPISANLSHLTFAAHVSESEGLAALLAHSIGLEHWQGEWLVRSFVGCDGGRS